MEIREWAHWLHSLGLGFPLTQATLPAACTLPPHQGTDPSNCALLGPCAVFLPRAASPPRLLLSTNREVPGPGRGLHLGLGPAPSCPGQQQAHKEPLKDPTLGPAQPWLCALAASVP